MPETFLFNVPAPVDPALEDPVSTVRLYESADGLTNWALVDTIAVLALADHVSGKKQWTSALSDETFFHMIVPVSAAGAEGTGKFILPPRPSSDLCTIFVNTRDILGVAAESVDFAFQLNGTRVNLGGSLTSLGVHEFDTDVNGQLSVPVLKGAKVNITSSVLGKRTITVDTTGLDVVDLATWGV